MIDAYVQGRVVMVSHWPEKKIECEQKREGKRNGEHGG